MPQMCDLLHSKDREIWILYTYHDDVAANQITGHWTMHNVTFVVSSEWAEKIQIKV